MGGVLLTRPPGIFAVEGAPSEVVMGGMRITIGGLDVRPHPDGAAASALPDAENPGTAGAVRAHPRGDSSHAPVTLAVAPAPQMRCPIPAGPWRIISTFAVLGLIFSLIAVLRECQRRTE
jgi:hypothetical protein